MRVEPIGDKVVVKRLDAKERTEGGILLPDSARQTPQQGKVLSVGEGVRLANGKRVMHQVREGERVLFNSYAGIDVEVEGEELLIMSESEILAVFE